MPSKSAETSTTSQQGGNPAEPRSAVPYYVAALFAAAAMAWYLFVFVPAKLEYFVGLRLRTLAVASSQVKTKAENLASALRRAPAPAERSANVATAETGTERYLRILVPDIQLARSGEPRPPGLRLTASFERPAAAPLMATVAWGDVAAPAAAVSLEDFDDLVLAGPGGEVLWQRENTTPRIGNLAQVIDAASSDKGWFSFNWTPRTELPKADAKALPTAVAVKEVDLGGRANLLVVQAITLSADGIEPIGDASAESSSKSADAAATAQRPKTMYVAGVVSMATLRDEAMNVPLAWVVVLSLPVILLFLALPFVKLATLTARERFSFVDVLLLLVATVATAGLAATIPLTETAVDDETDTALTQFASSIDDTIAADVNDVRQVGELLTENGNDDAIASKLQDCRVQITPLPLRRCNLWAAFPSNARVRPGGIDLDVVIWLDERGDQIDKWTTKAQVTGLADHRQFQHFRDLSVDRLWDAPAARSGSTRLATFTMEPLRAPTTAELGVIVAFPLKGNVVASAVVPSKDDAGTRGVAPEPNRRSARYLALNVRPRSLLDAVVPSGYGFAVITPDGKVLFHSQENLSLEENFFEEVGEPRDVRARAQSGHVVTWSGDYHGRPHRIHLQRVARIGRCPWLIVTFREMEPVLAGVIAHQSGSFRLALLNLLALAVVATAVATRAQLKRRDVRDLLNVRNVTDPRWLVGLVVLVVASFLVLLLSYVSSAAPWLDLIYVFFVFLPLFALAVSARARRAAPAAGPTESDARWRRLVSAEMAMLVLLVAALPAAGFARIVERVQTSRRDAQWLEEMQRRIAARNERVLARVNGPSYADPIAPTGEQARADVRRTSADVVPAPNPSESARPFDVRGLLKSSGFAHVSDPRLYTYAFTFMPVEVASGSAAGRGVPERGQKAVRFLLEWNPFPSRDVAGEPHVTVQDDGTLRLDPIVSGTPALAIGDTSLDWPASVARATSYSLPRAKLVFGLVLLGGTILGFYWARRKLLAYASPDAPSLEAALACLPDAGNHGVLLVGAPRTQKDSVVREVLKKFGRQTARRIRLLDTVADTDFVDAQIKALNPPASGTALRAPAVRLNGPGRIWIHVSNLETHLVDPERRRLALALLERLIESGTAPPTRVIIVTTNVDPIVHFEEIFDEERKGIYADAIPEVELSRFALLLTHFHRCYVPITGDDAGTDPWWNYDPKNWRTVLQWETHSPALHELRDELMTAWTKRDAVSIDDLSRCIAARAVAFYQLLWTSCTRREKLVLVQLAQEGFVTPQSSDVVSALMAKGLIVRRPGPAVFNYTFRAFLRNIERTNVVQQWERMEGHGLWVVAGRLIASSLVAGGLFFLLTQGYSVEGLLPVLSGTGVFGVPLVRNVMARFAGKSSPEPANA